MAKLSEVTRRRTGEDLTAKADEILRKAEEKGVTKNFFFVTTFRRYQVQMQIMDALKAAMDEDGPLVVKEYVKGRKNIVANPAITEYNRTATAANGTVATLLNIVKNLPEEKEKEKSKLELLLDEA